MTSLGGAGTPAWASAGLEEDALLLPPAPKPCALRLWMTWCVTRATSCGLTCAEMSEWSMAEVTALSSGVGSISEVEEAGDADGGRQEEGLPLEADPRRRASGAVRGGRHICGGSAAARCWEEPRTCSMSTRAKPVDETGLREQRGGGGEKLTQQACLRCVGQKPMQRRRRREAGGQAGRPRLAFSSNGR